MCKSALSILNAIDLTLAAMLAVFIAVSVWGSPVHHNANPYANKINLHRACGFALICRSRSRANG
eukprot:SAG31_NODE_1316_length_8838_cov_11.005031_4_plen_65_part_00